jgi:hypothetical protein
MQWSFFLYVSFSYCNWNRDFINRSNTGFMILEKAQDEECSWAIRFYTWRLLTYLHVVSYASQKLMKAAIKSGCMMKEFWLQCFKFMRWSRVDTWGQNLNLQISSLPHCLTNTASQTDRPVTICEKAIPTMFHDGVTTPSPHMDGNDFSDLIWTVEIQWAWMEDETASGHRHQCGTSDQSTHEVLQNRIDRLHFLVLKSHWRRENFPVTTSNYPPWKLKYQGTCRNMQMHRVVITTMQIQSDILFKMGCQPWTTEGKVQGRRGSWPHVEAHSSTRV